jgi:hypothetical protein
MKSQNLFSISLLLLVASSCTIHKRHYSKGYFISWNKAYKSEQPIEQEKPHEHIVSKTIDEEILEQEEIQVEQIIDFKSQYTNVDNEQKYSTQKVNKSFSLENTTVLGNRVNKIKVYTNEEQKVNLNALLGFCFWRCQLVNYSSQHASFNLCNISSFCFCICRFTFVTSIYKGH